MVASNPGSVTLPENEEDEDKPAAAAIKKPMMKGGGSSTTRNTTKAVTKDESLAASPAKNLLASTASKKAPAPLTRATVVAAAKPTAMQDPDNEEFKITPGNKEKRAAVDAKNKWVHDELKPQHLEACKTYT
jgi:hypothetical protein